MVDGIHQDRGLRQAVLMTALVVAWGTCYLFFGERLPRGDGTGWDGQIYSYITQNLFTAPLEVNPYVNRYYVERCLPCLSVRLAHEVFGRNYENKTILNTFLAQNILLLGAAVVCTCLCAGELGIGLNARWLVFGGLFGSFALAKQSYFCACSTDVTAFALSTFLFLAWLRRSTVGVVACTVLGAFAWPTAGHVGTLLLLFPRSPADEATQSSAARPAPAQLHWWLAALVAGTLLGLSYFWIIRPRFHGYQPESVGIWKFLPLSVAGLTILVGLAVKELANWRVGFDWRTYVAGLRFGPIGSLLATWGLIFAFRALLNPFFPPGAPFSTATFIKLTLVSGVQKPLLFLVAHVFYFGPVILLTVAHWRGVSQEAHRHGMGLTLVLLFGLFLGVNSESRQIINFMPFVVLLTVRAVDRCGWDVRRVIWFTLLSLFCSRVWLPLTYSEWPKDDLVFQFPMQLFFMNHGVYTTRLTYWIEVGAVVVLAVLTAWPTWKRHAVAQAPAFTPRLAQAA